MSQATDYTIVSAPRAETLADLNSVFGATQSLNSGSSEPSSIAAMLWADSTSSPWTIKIRDHTDNTWTSLFDTDGNIDAADIDATGDVTIGGDLDVTVGDIEIGNGQLFIPGGAFDAPAIAFSAEPTTGIAQLGAGRIDFRINTVGVLVVRDTSTTFRSVGEIAMNVVGSGGTGTMAVAAANGSWSDIALLGDTIFRAVDGSFIITARNASGDIKFSTGATDSLKMIIESGGDIEMGGDLTVGGASELTGNVKIGAAGVPTQMLHLLRTDANVMQVKLANTDTDVGYGASAGLARIFVGGNEKLRMGATATTFNQGLVDTDFNVRGDTDANLLFINAGTDRVGIGTNTPSALLDVAGDAIIEEDLQVDGDLILNGDTYWIGAGTGIPYADMYANDNTTTTSVSSAAFTQIAIFDTNGHSNLATPISIANHINIVKAGVYMVDCCITVANNAGSGHKIEIVIAKNNGTVIFANCRRHRTLASGTDVGAMPICGHIDVAVNDTIEVWATSDSGSSKNITIEDINLNLTMVGGT